MKFLALFATGSGLIIVGFVVALISGDMASLRVVGLAAIIVGTIVLGVNVVLQFLERRRQN
ncbi:MULTISPECIES: hypothetical protein [unclassified Plantibacter]|jgi:hypothetical protein|uniref:hypothetical protein n=1 Tax=unclassified Plantibacter TaxID=2624265 RepID=UPI003D32BDBF